MVNISDTLTALKSKTFSVDCIDMLLTQQGEGAAPITFRGKGLIQQESDDTFAFKMFVTEFENTDRVRQINAMFGSRKPGTLYEDADKYSLTAKAFDGTIWETSDIIPRAHWPREDEPICTGSINRLTTKIHGGDRHGASLYYLEEAELPCIPVFDRTLQRTEPRSEFQAAGCQFSVVKGEQQFVISAESPIALDVSFHTRIDEALKFLTAKPLQWRMMMRNDGQTGVIELTGLPPKIAKTRLDPPINGSNPGWYQHGWALFSKYLEYVLATTDHPYWSHCSYHLHNAIEASANSMDAWAVGVSVAVEGLSNVVPFERSKPELDELTGLHRWILELVDASETFKKFHARLKQLFGMMKNTNVKTRLAPLVASGHVSSEYVTAWGALRNQVVHPQVRDLRNSQFGDFQKLFDRLNRTTVLMYQIVFYLIGYRGPFADYGTHGYPTVDYPLALPTPPEAAA